MVTVPMSSSGPSSPLANFSMPVLAFGQPRHLVLHSVGLGPCFAQFLIQKGVHYEAATAGKSLSNVQNSPR
jgi:hypothetical protein